MWTQRAADMILEPLLLFQKPLMTAINQACYDMFGNAA